MVKKQKIAAAEPNAVIRQIFKKYLFIFTLNKKILTLPCMRKSIGLIYTLKILAIFHSGISYSE